jgi:GDP-L-fucose synthase
VNLEAKIYIAGHRGMVGSAIVRRLQRDGYANLVTRTSQELDLRNQAGVDQFFAEEEPAYVFLAAAHVGGIQANNTQRAEFIYDNLAIQTNVIHAAWRHGAAKLAFLGSSCIYPRDSPQPIREEYLMTGPLEPTNEPYALAKIAGIVMAQSYRRQYGFNAISLMPTNLYGPNDNYDLATSHVLPALIRKFHEAKKRGSPEVSVWGSGHPRREFLHVDDLADAAVHLMRTYDKGEIVNIGVGDDISIADLALLIAEVVGYQGDIVFDPTKPDGPPRKLLDVSRLAGLGWRAGMELRTGVAATYQAASPELDALR